MADATARAAAAVQGFLGPHADRPSAAAALELWIHCHGRTADAVDWQRALSAWDTQPWPGQLTPGGKR